MAKTFYTERDIEDLVKQGILSLEVNDHVVLTDLAFEKANRLGMRLVGSQPDTPPGAPVRPYIAQKPAPRAPANTSPVFAPIHARCARWRQRASTAHPQRGDRPPG